MRRDSVSFQLADINMPLSTVAVIAAFQRSNVLDDVTELHKTQTSELIIRIESTLVEPFWSNNGS